MNAAAQFLNYEFVSAIDALKRNIQKVEMMGEVRYHENTFSYLKKYFGTITRGADADQVKKIQSVDETIHVYVTA